MIKIADNFVATESAIDEIEYDQLEESEFSHEKIHSSLVEETRHFFIPDGVLSTHAKFSGRKYEYREQQTEMALATSEAFKKNHNLCVEAPTGVGKSFAYLIPAINYAVNEVRPVIITTETINLQEQLINKDIPLIKSILKKAKKDNYNFRAVIAKGRSNYLCYRRLAIATDERQNEIFTMNSMAADAKRIAEWAVEDAVEGSMSEIKFRFDASVWSYLCSEGGNCRGPKCDFFKKCFYWKARREWDRADIIIANHALFFTDMKIRYIEEAEGNLLPAYSAVIVDEAHVIEDTAASQLGIFVAESGVKSYLNRLYNAENGKGLLVRSGELATKIRAKIAELFEASTAFFSLINNLFNELNVNNSENTIRVTTPHIVPDTLTEIFGDLSDLLNKYIEELAFNEDDDFKQEMEAQLLRCDGFIAMIFNFLNMSLESHVYWLEKTLGVNSNITLQSAPLDVNDHLFRLLFNQDRPVIVTSATLAVNDSLQYFRQRSGYANGGELILDSPFDPKQLTLYLPKYMPNPNDTSFDEAAAKQIINFTKKTHGKAFVLFTSYRSLVNCAELTEEFFEDNDITQLVQGRDMGRSRMVEIFKEDIDSVLFGTTSFWTGVDVPGEALSNVIVTKLPFAVPSHPLIKARCEKIEAQNKSPFFYYSLPEAILKLRQGIGRLIRSRQDEGIVVLLDNRVTTKGYGKTILNSLPPFPIEYF
ncbi:helicase C-terminal domain-containing protein [Lentisphaerota bacterium WC36G]|nr:DEAD/DEAH box helicase [Lentisphaerae bacterium WC36]